MRRNRARLLLAGAILLMLAVLAAPGIARLAPVRWLDGQAENTWFQLRGPRPVSDQVAILAIDQTAFDSLPLPTAFWGEYYAEAIRRLAQTGAAVIALDVYFSAFPPLPDEATPVETELKQREMAQYSQLGAALAEARFVHDCPVLLAAFLEDGQLRPPRDELVAGAGGGTDTLGAVNLLTSRARDEVIREFAVSWPSVSAGGTGVSSLPALGAHYMIAGDLQPQYATGLAPTTLRINYAGPAGTLPRASLAEILAAGPDELDRMSKAWRGRLVFVGDTALPQDMHLTPYSRRGPADEGVSRMPGVEVLANVADTLIAQRPLAPLPLWLVLVVSGAVLVLSALAVYLLPWLAGVVVDLGIASGVEMACYLLFKTDIVLPGGMILVLLALHGGLARLLKYILLERERRLLADYFSRYTSPRALQHVIDDEQRRLLEGERCEVVVMFYDIRGFTTMSENAVPSDTIAYLTRFHDCMSGIITSYGGWVDKFLGDGALVLFGFPLQSDDAPSQAVRCARELIVATAEFAPLTGEGRLAIGVGLNYGSVVVGNIGSATKLDFTAVGDTVNTAARVQDLCKKHGRPLLMTDAVAGQLAQDEFEMISLGNEAIRGRSAVELFACQVDHEGEE